MLLLDSLEMLVTCEPVAELDAALSQAVRRRDAERLTGDQTAVAVLSEWIDRRLDQRLELDG